MSSTRTTLGEQATLKGLVENILTDFTEESSFTLRRSGFRGNDNLETLSLAETVGLKNNGNDFYYLPNSGGMSGIFLNNSSKLIFISSVDAARYISDDTDIGRELCAFYVPDAMLSTYLSNNATWNYPHLIKAASDYPLTDFSTVSDSWAEIVAAAADGTHASKYEKRKAVKQLTYGSYTVYMQYIGDRTEGPVWAVKNFAETRRFHSAMTPYDGSEIDTYVNETVYSQLPSELQAGIAEVSIPYYDGVAAEEKSIDRKVWLLSSQEVGFTGTNMKESTGTVFSDTFTSTSNYRIKHNRSTGSANAWWTRSSRSSTYVFNVNDSGSYGGTAATYPCGVVFGFCLKGPSS